VILKVLNVLEYGSISPNRTLNMIFEFCNLKFLSIRSNVKRVASSALYKWFAILSQVRRADRKGQSRKIRAEWPSSVWATYFCWYSISGVDNDVSVFSRCSSRYRKLYKYQKRVENFSISLIPICEVERIFSEWGNRKVSKIRLKTKPLKKLGDVIKLNLKSLVY